MTASVPHADLVHLGKHLGQLAPELATDLKHARLFITGGTGFFGVWLLESFAYLNETLSLQASATVLTRDPEAFKRRFPHLANNTALHFREGDVRHFQFPTVPFTHVIHGATAASAALVASNPTLMLDTIAEGTRRTLEFARQTGARRFLLASSGAVYGRQPAELSHLAEDYLGAPDPLDPRSCYGQGKRLAEHLCALYRLNSPAGEHTPHQLEPVIARCFAFVGPHLPMDTHFAIGNFIRNGLRGEPIAVGGDGTAYRSYLYAADLMIWLWTLLVRGTPCRAYNVGSESAVSIRELAETVGGIFGVPVQVALKPVEGRLAERYVPSTARAQEELGLRTFVSLSEAIEKTRQWAISRSLP